MIGLALQRYEAFPKKETREEKEKKEK